MSNSTSNDTDQFRFRLPPAEAKVAIGLAAALFGLCAVQFKDFGLLQLLLMAVFFAAGILTRRAWAIYVMLGLFIALKYVIIHPHFRRQLNTLEFSDHFLALILILLTAACFRFLDTSRFTQAFYPNVKLGEKPKSDVRFEFPSLLGGRWWAIPLAVVLASALLAAAPHQMLFIRRVGVTYLGSRLIFLTLLLFFCWFICRAAIGTVIRWRMKPVQADVHCRSLIAKEMWKDVYSIEKRRQKNRSRE